MPSVYEGISCHSRVQAFSCSLKGWHIYLNIKNKKKFSKFDCQQSNFSAKFSFSSFCMEYNPKNYINVSKALKKNSIIK